VSPTQKIEAELLSGTALSYQGVVAVQVTAAPAREHMYDLTAEGWHNFVLEKSGLVVSNSPDRNYHFRPPAHEATINQFNQVFGFIWEDAELSEFLEFGLDMISAAPPRTPFRSCEDLIQCRPEWRTLMLTGAASYALLALMINWISDEFSLSGDTKVRIRLPEGDLFDISLEDLYSVSYGPHDDKTEIRKRIRAAFEAGNLQVEAVDEATNQVSWRPISDVLQHRTGHKKAFRVTTQGGLDVTATEDHSLFLFKEGGVAEVLTGDLKAGDLLALVLGSTLTADPISSITEVPPLDYSYDLSVPGPENFVLSNGVVAHNTYSIGGVSLDIDKSSKYESAANNFKDLFQSQLEQAKATVKIIKGLQQPRYGVGIRSSFGPYSSGGALTPQKFIGF
jgi:hypothetical protein